MEKRRALITGITGQDGSYLAELLLEKGYEVFGMVRRASTEQFERIAHLLDRITLVQADLLDQFSLVAALEEARPAEVYNLAAQSFVPDVLAPARPHGRVHRRRRHADARGDPQLPTPPSASTRRRPRRCSGRSAEVPQTESTPFYPRSPYGVAKAYGHFITVNYRESYGLYAVSGILFNHESPRRGLEFVTRKITDGVARIKLGLVDELRLGNLEAKRDWGFAGDYVEAMWLMLQRDEPTTTSSRPARQHSVREFVETRLRARRARSGGRTSSSIRVSTGRPRSITWSATRRAREVELGWEPRVSFEHLVADDGGRRPRTAVGARARRGGRSSLA